jgi:hypothetical protein
LKIGLLQLNSTVGDFAANRQKLLAGYEKAVALGAEFILAPELFLCGYPPRDLVLRADFIDADQKPQKVSARFRFVSAALTTILKSPDARCEIPPPSCRAEKSSGARKKACCRPMMFSTKTVILNPRKKSNLLFLMAASLASQSARTSGTTRISGPNRFTAAIRCAN